MAAPNIVNVSSIFGKTVGAALSTTSADILTNTANSNKVFKINSIYIANVDGTVAADVSVTWYDFGTTTSYSLAKTVAVPPDATIIVVDKNSQIYLEEGDKIAAFASVAGDLEIIISYEEIS
jgi:hypothetical protein